jgi:hypothetical protein
MRGCDVSERISDAMLTDIEKTAAPPFEAPTPSSWRHTSVSLARELRRLRELIAFLGEPETAEVVPPSLTQDLDEQVGKGILHEGPWTLTVRQRGEEIPRLMAEARTIREERGR